jgi:hypothetical protein
MSDYTPECQSPSTDTSPVGTSSNDGAWGLEGVSFIDKLGLQYSLTPEQVFDLKALHHVRLPDSLFFHHL